VLDVLPAMGTTGLQIEYGTINPTTHAFSPFGSGYSDAVIQSISADGKITLQPTYTYSATKHHEFVKIAAHIKAKPDAFEVKSFADKQTTAEFTIDVREGIAYITGYDADNKPIEGSMLYLDNDEDGTKPNYTILNAAWATNLPAGDVCLKAGWYSVENSMSVTGRNIRVEGDANFVFASGKYVDLDAGKSLMDASTSKSYKLNILPAKGATYVAYSALRKIQDFSDVNILMPKVSADLDKIGTANIAAGLFGNLENIGTLNFKSGTVTGKVDNVTTATISGTSFNTLSNIATLNFKEGTVTGMYKIGTANIDDGTFDAIASPVAPYGTFAMADITTLNFKKGTVNSNLTKIGDATISDGTFGSSTSRITMGGTTLNIKKGTVYASEIKSALIIDGGTVDVNANGTGKSAITGNVTMNDGTLTVVANDNGKQAIVGDVKVVKGTFTAQNDNYAAVNGTLTGKFQGSIDNGNNWTDITTATSSAARIKNVVPAP